MEKKIFSFLMFLFLLTNSVFAQDLVSQIISILPQFVGVIFILIFILLLLAVGGVLPKPTGRLPIGVIFFLILVVLLFIIPQFVKFPDYMVIPEDFKKETWKLPPGSEKALSLIGLPEDWAYVPAIIYLFILPFAAIYTLVWAFLTSIKVFEGAANVNRILAFIISFITIPLGWFVKIVWVLFSFMGIWSIVIFAATFILGIFFKGYGISAGEYYKSMTKKWRDTAVNYLQNALRDLGARQAGSAQNNLNAAKNIAGFSTNYYNYITQAINALTPQPGQQIDWAAAENAVRNALREIS
ncbi:MAG: hypothetical protein QXG39_07840 [Candidatus Aenigmatarchaeota archaeon]